MNPSNGRIVHYWPAKPTSDQQQPYAAIVTHVTDPHLVNLAVFSPQGNSFPAMDVPFVLDGEPQPDNVCFAAWPIIAKEVPIVMDAASQAAQPESTSAPASSADTPPSEPATT